jgi:hypothetical protein
MGKRTSVYLTDELAAAVKASGVPLAELVRRGLAATPMLPFDDQPADGPSGDRPAPDNAGDACAHPPGRILKGLCMACGTRPPLGSLARVNVTELLRQ